MSDHSSHPLIKEVPGHLLQFEETIFGMTLTHLLTDLGMGGMIILLTSSLPLIPHIIVDAVLVLMTLILVLADADDRGAERGTALGPADLDSAA